MTKLPLHKIALFLIGFAGIIHETVTQHGERPTLLLLFAACMGLPAFFGGGGMGPKK